MRGRCAPIAGKPAPTMSAALQNPVGAGLPAIGARSGPELSKPPPYLGLEIGMKEIRIVPVGPTAAQRR